MDGSLFRKPHVTDDEYPLEESHLLRQRGFGQAKTATVLAAVELAQRLARIRMPERRLMERPDLVAGYLWMRYSQNGREVVGALYLDVHKRLIEERELARGILSRTAVDTRMFLKPALDCGAAQMIMFHTHPSGHPAPSTDDLTFTDRLAEAAEIFEMELVDHLIPCRQYVSLHKRLAGEIISQPINIKPERTQVCIGQCAEWREKP